MKEEQLIAWTALQASMDVTDTAARTMAMAVIMHRALWLQSSGIPKELQLKVEDLPFNREKLFSVKTDNVLHSMRDSSATLRTLAIDTSPNKTVPKGQRHLFPPATAMAV